MIDLIDLMKILFVGGCFLIGYQVYLTVVIYKAITNKD